uniref:Serrate RNA effector molecule homolog n=1 Tax=Rhabditophanes sp. KR3021 TaxID=114890 RepID=A0AC35TS13_9BILA
MNESDDFNFRDNSMDNGRSNFGGNFNDRRQFNTHGKRLGPRNDFGFNKRGRMDSHNDGEVPSTDSNNATTMMTYKVFVNTIGDEASEEELQQKYTEYKDKFRAENLLRFFNEHKNEEWYRLKYHPLESLENKQKKKEFVNQRFEVYQKYIVEKDLLKDITLDHTNADYIDKIFEAMVGHLEGVSEEDIEKYLNDEPVDDKSNGEEESETAADSTPRQRKPLVKYAGIFLRTVAPNITVREIEEVCEKYDSYVRVGLTDPVMDRTLTKKGWVTLKEDANVKSVCWELNTLRIRSTELGAILNKDVPRIRTANGMVAHNSIARNDLKQAAKLITLMDRKHGLYYDENQTDEVIFSNLEMAIVYSKNPLLDDITDLLIEEGTILDEDDGSNGKRLILTRDSKLLSRLDKLIIYLRIVHSIDYYYATAYPIEDTMPNKCGVLHIRAEPMAQFKNNESGQYNISESFIDNHMKEFNNKLNVNVLHCGVVNEEEMVKLGKKDADTEEENFINANCIELQPGKWLCELSGKKFKNADFVKKHLRSKHQDKIDEARASAEFYNNYIADPKRIQDSEPHQANLNTSSGGGPDSEQRMGGGGHMYHGGGNRNFVRQNNWNDGPRRSFNGNRGYHNNGGGGNFNNYQQQPRFNNDMGGQGFGDHMRRDPRQPVIYKDLDAPEDTF